MTRTAKAARLMTHIAEPFVEVYPADAARLQLSDADIAEISSPLGTAIVRVLVTDRQRPGSLFAPIHWTDQLASAARIDALIGAATDPVSGQPELKATPVAIQRFNAAWYGFAISRERPSAAAAEYWALAPAKSGWRVELAGLADPPDWTAFARGVLGLEDDEAAELLAYHDAGSGQHRFAAFDGGRLKGAVFIARQPVTVSRSWAAERLGREATSARERLTLLAGCAGTAEKDRGAIVCACFEVGVNDIVGAIAHGGCTSVEAVGVALKAGTNCGSCRSEIGRLVHDHCIAQAV